MWRRCRVGVGAGFGCRAGVEGGVGVAAIIWPIQSACGARLALFVCCLIGPRAILFSLSRGRAQPAGCEREDFDEVASCAASALAAAVGEPIVRKKSDREEDQAACKLELYMAVARSRDPFFRVVGSRVRSDPLRFVFCLSTGRPPCDFVFVCRLVGSLAICSSRGRAPCDVVFRVVGWSGPLRFYLLCGRPPLRFTFCLSTGETARSVVTTRAKQHKSW